MLNKNSATPIYAQLEEYIKDNIKNKVYLSGTALPTEREFTELFGVSRMTVRQAISNLVNEGVLYKIKSKGAFVSKEIIEKQLEIQSFSQDMRGRGHVPGSKLIELTKIIPDEEVRKNLGLADTEEVYFLNRLRLADGEPMAMEYCYIPYKYFPDLNKYNMEHCSLYEIMINDYNLQIGYIKQSLKAVRMYKKEAELLIKKVRGFGLLSVRILYNSYDIPMEYTKTIYHPDRYNFNMVVRK